MQQAVALIDVDHTLMFDSSDSVNAPLLESLLERNVKRIFLFTDMTFNFHAVEERNRLVKTLEQMGFAVQGVITPNDLTWSMVDSLEAHRLHQMCFIDRMYKGNLFGPAFESFIIANQAEIPNIHRAATSYAPSQCILGEAFNETSLALHSVGDITEDVKCRSVFAKVLTDHLSEQLGYRHNKGLLLDAFIRHKPVWVASIIVYDDNASVVQDVQTFHPVPVGEKVGHISTCTLGAVTVPPLTMVPVTSAALSIDYYRAALEAHFSKCP